MDGISLYWTLGLSPPVDFSELLLFPSGFLRLDSCTDSDPWMYGSIRRFGDLLVLCDFRVIFGAIFGEFRSSLDSGI